MKVKQTHESCVYQRRELTDRQKRNRKGCIIAVIMLVVLILLSLAAVFVDLIVSQDFNAIVLVGIILACGSFIALLGVSFHLGVRVKNWSKTDEQLLAEKPKIKRKSVVLLVVFSLLCASFLALLLVSLISQEDWAVSISRSAFMIISILLLMCCSFVIALFALVVWGMNSADWKRAKRNLEQASQEGQLGSGDVATEKRRKKEQKQQFPDLAWFASKGMPLKDIPIDKKVLKNGFTDEQKYILSVASFALARKKAIIMLIIIGSVLVVTGLLAIFMGALAIVFGVLGLLLCGGFVTYKTTRLFEGMDILKANRRIGIPAKWSLLFALLSFVGSVMSFYMTFIFMLMQSSRREVMTNMPRVAMPQNYEFDDVISIYADYEQSAGLAQAWDEHMAHVEEDDYNRKTRELKDLKSDVERNEDLTFTDKQTLTSKIDDKQKDLDEDFEKHTKPRL